MRFRRPSRAVLAALGALLAACAAPRDAPPTQRGRGYLLITVAGLRADRLGCYGASPSAAPFLDSLAARGARFERVFVPSPSTLVSHLSLITALEPPEHGVEPPLGRLAPSLPTLAERFSAGGYRTAGFTDDGFVSSAWGFDRGFDRFVDPPRGPHAPSPLDRAARFLGELDADERFFLFVHTSVAGTSREGVAAERYAAAVERLDGELRRFFADFDRLGLGDETTVVLVADHGFELGDHGATGHRQLYPETLRVPLILFGPGIAPGLEPAGLVRSLDVAPTLYALAALPPPRRLGGRSLVPDLRGAPAAEGRSAYAESGGWTPQRSLLEESDGATWQLLRSGVVGERDGTWVSRSVRFDAAGPELSFRIVSYARERRVTLSLDDEPLTSWAVRTRWTSAQVSLPPRPGRHRLELATDGCTPPRALGNGTDPRCLSFKVQGLDLSRTELFELRGDPAARDDLSARRPGVAQRLSRRLETLRLPLLEAPQRLRPSGEVVEILGRLGYLDPLPIE